MRADPQLVLFGTAGLMAMGLLTVRLPDLVLYNDTPSMPIGLYLRTHEPVRRGAIVTLIAQRVSSDYARVRGAGPRFRFLKRVAGVAGDVVCAAGNELRINDEVRAVRQTRDSMGRALPAWSGCRTLQRDQFVVLGETEDSYDSRYFGVVSGSDIEGVWASLFVNPYRTN